ncbi:DUF4062 domain-containing protein [Zoogloea sp.]|jgi:nucleoside 2-deoxyribosyltransferase|uniref:DUF4062 domain-containing protein n=1 Tax=Zoogloea sp. TaxID=49181 RepID=UPI002D0D8D99|nr:DUF4062 domain-containing protein [Zoogloea sp.]HPI60017.1 DUF4062 domain-containing protein [Zoogloea sp.]
MAKPRVFISSTYYDLKSIRADLERFIRDQGYEPVMHERGHIPYGKEDKPEEYAYREIDYCDIIICIVGGKFGTASDNVPYSITQTELKTAFAKGKQVYVFIERTVREEHTFYRDNKAVSGVKYRAVDNVKVYEFLEEIFALPQGNPIFSFDTSQDITTLLQEQWAGLFQRLLSEQSQKPQAELIHELQRNIQTIGQLAQYLIEARAKGDDAINEILFANHPIFEQIKKLLSVTYRIYFTNLEEFTIWLDSARSFTPVFEENWDDSEFMEFVRFYTLKEKGRQEQRLLKIKKDVFHEDGTLKPFTADRWDPSWVRLEKLLVAKTEPADDDIPF